MNRICFGDVPIVSSLQTGEDVNQIEIGPAAICFDEGLGFGWLEHKTDLALLQRHSAGLNCFEPEEHFDDLFPDLSDMFSRYLSTKKISVCAASFKDTSLIDRLSQGYDVKRSDLSSCYCCQDSEDKKLGVETIQDVVDIAAADKLVEIEGLQDVIICRHLVEHAYDFERFVDGIAATVRIGGLIFFEFPSCEKSFVQADCSIYWEEHTFYFSEQSFLALIEKKFPNLEAIYHRTFHLSGESISVALFRKLSQPSVRLSKDVCIKEGQLDLAGIRSIQTSVDRSRNKVRASMAKIKQLGYTVVLYGAGHLAVTFVHCMRLLDFVDLVVDDDPGKQGLYIPRLPNNPVTRLDRKLRTRPLFILLALNVAHHEKVLTKLSSMGLDYKVASIFSTEQSFVGRL